MLTVPAVVLISLGLGGCMCSLVLVEPDVQVLSPSAFDVILPPDENGTLTDIRVSINKALGIEEPEYRKENAIGGVIHFSDKSLKIEKGDIFYYRMSFDDGDQGEHWQEGYYVFKGEYKRKRRDRRRREVYERNSAESSEEKDVSEEQKYDRHRHGPPHGHYNPHGPRHHHSGPHHFFPPLFGGPGYHGPGLWKDQGYDRKDKFGNNGPWDRHDDDDCDSFGHRPKYPGPDQHPDHRNPWHGHGDNPYDNNNGNKNNGNGNKGFDNPYGDNKPGKGPGSGNGREDDPNKTDRSSENPNVEIFTTRRPSTTQRTTTVPNIDIRFRMPEDN